MSAVATRFDPRTVPGYAWLPSGQSVLAGDVLVLATRLDRLFLRWAERWTGEELAFPPTIAAAALQKVDYFRSFPHLATFAECLDADEPNLRAFAEAPWEGDALRLTRRAPLRAVLTPAACYHVYAFLEGECLAARRVVTTRATCFRREQAYAPLRRQWSFSMREVVCLGTEDDVDHFLDDWRRALERFAAMARLPVVFAAATDPFFSPATSAAHLAQRLEPSKTEMVFEGDLAIASLNDHRTTFGEAFGITRDGAPARSACVAFGLERWIYAVMSRADAAGVGPLEWLEEVERDA